ncbi:MAG: MBL fold metallo-hydrolase [Phaeodactylibacter sp.]|nr:MBL fold metallo-hydrolase [Phaeodactylibacter sp.]
MMKKPPRLSFGQKVTWGNRPPYHSLKAKDGLITTPKYQFKLIPIPGHALDMVALYEPDRKWLFSADLYINAYIGYFLADEHIYQQVASIKKMLTLDFEVLLCSHNPQFENGKRKLKDKLVFLEDFIDRASGLYRKGYSVKEIFQMMELKENKVVNFISGGHLSKLNMVKSVVRYVDEA